MMQSVLLRLKLLEIDVQPAFEKLNVDFSYQQSPNCNILLGKTGGNLAKTFSQRTLARKIFRHCKLTGVG